MATKNGITDLAARCEALGCELIVTTKGEQFVIRVDDDHSDVLLIHRDDEDEDLASWLAAPSRSPTVRSVANAPEPDGDDPLPADLVPALAKLREFEALCERLPFGRVVTELEKAEYRVLQTPGYKSRIRHAGDEYRVEHGWTEKGVRCALAEHLLLAVIRGFAGDAESVIARAAQGGAV